MSKEPEHPTDKDQQHGEQRIQSMVFYRTSQPLEHLLKYAENQLQTLHHYLAFGKLLIQYFDFYGCKFCSGLYVLPGNVPRLSVM